MYCSTDNCAAGGRDRSDLVYVGPGHGEFTVEPQMKYVGYGGDYGVRRMGGCCGPCCLILGPLLGCLLLSLGLLCYMFWPGGDECQNTTDYLYHWSTQKTMRCCMKGYVACPVQTTTFVPVINSGPVDPYNCADGFLNWQAGWSTEKKVWCCNEHGKGCGSDAEVPAAQYDCNAAMANWVKGWSEGKKTWCCARGSPTCPQDAASAGMGYGAGTQHGADFNGAPVAPIRNVPHSWAVGR